MAGVQTQILRLARLIALRAEGDFGVSRRVQDPVLPGPGSRRVQDRSWRRSDATNVSATPTRPALCLDASGHVAQRARCTIADIVVRAMWEKRERYNSACNPLVDVMRLAWGNAGRGMHCVAGLLRVSTKVSIPEYHRDR